MIFVNKVFSSTAILLVILTVVKKVSLTSIFCLRTALQLFFLRLALQFKLFFRMLHEETQCCRHITLKLFYRDLSSLLPRTKHSYVASSSNFTNRPLKS